MAKSKRIYVRAFVPDIHVPLHDETYIHILCDVFSQEKIDELVILGDFWECYSVSSHPKDPRKDPVLLQYEIEHGQDVLQRISRAAKARRRFFLEGNHEQRISRYLCKNAPKLIGSFEPRDILGIPKDMFFIPYGKKQHLKCGNRLVACHGAFTNKWHSEKHRAQFGTSVVYGHTHQVQISTQKNVYGDIFYGISLGWGGDEEKVAEYINAVPQWQQAFGLFYFLPDGNFFWNIVQVINGKAYFQGKLYR